MLKQILVGPGGRDYTVAAISQAVALGMAHGAELTGVSVIDPGRIFGGTAWHIIRNADQVLFLA